MKQCLLLLLIFVTTFLKAQNDGCLNAPEGQSPSSVFIPECTGVPEIIINYSFTGSYSLVQLTAGTEYTFYSSVSTDFVTISNEEGTEVLAAGITPLTWTADSDRVVRFYLHLNENCEADGQNGMARSRVVFCGEPLPPPVNDDCNSAIELSCGESHSGNTAYATDSDGNVSGDVFYTYTGSGTPQYVTVSLCGSDFDTYLSIFSDCTLETEIAANDNSNLCGLQSNLTFQSDGVSTYIILIEGVMAQYGNYEINVSCEDVPPPPSNCEEHQVLSNGFENGFLFPYRIAIDIPVGENGFSIEGIEPTIAGPSDTEATSFAFKLYADFNGLPGDLLEEHSGSILSTELQGQNFGLDFIKYSVEFDSAITFAPNTTYWLEIITDGFVWELTSAHTSYIGSPAVTHQGETWFREEGEAVYEFICSEMGVSEVNNSSLTIYPNPFTSVVNIQLPENIKGNFTFKVTDLSGKTIYSKEQSNKSFSWNGSSLPKGIYILSIENNGKVIAQKVIKK